MAEQAAENKRDPNERSTPLTRAIDGQRRDLVTSAELRKVALPTQFLKGYRHGEVEDVLERAAASIDELARTASSLKSQLDEARNASAASEAVVTQMLSTAALVVEATKEEAKREAAELVARARGEAEQIGVLHEEAHAAVESARLEAAGILAAARPGIEEMTRAAHAEAEAVIAAARAEAYAARVEAESMLAAARAESESILGAARTEAEAMTSSARAERAQVIDDATRDASEARATLEQEKEKIDLAIGDLRETWASRISDAIARLDAIDPAGGAATPASGETPAENGDHHPEETDLASQLQERLGGGSDPEPPATVEPAVDQSDRANDRQ